MLCIINIIYLFIKRKNIAIFFNKCFTDKFQVLSKELFNVLREKYGASFDSFFWSKVHVVQGDTTLENMALEMLISLKFYREEEVNVDFSPLLARPSLPEFSREED